ncbi:MAG: hypothetical protein AAGK05_12670 [Pseudomonadota bacterium]
MAVSGNEERDEDEHEPLRKRMRRQLSPASKKCLNKIIIFKNKQIHGRLDEQTAQATTSASKKRTLPVHDDSYK